MAEFKQHRWPIPTADKESKLLLQLRSDAGVAAAAGDFAARNRLFKRHDDLVMKRWKEQNDG